MGKTIDIMEKLKADVSRKIREVREDKRLKGAEAAAELGVSTYGVYKSYEYGNRAPQMDLLHRIAKRWDVNLNWLLSVEEGPRYRNQNESRYSCRVYKEAQEYMLRLLYGSKGRPTIEALIEAHDEVVKRLMAYYAKPPDPKADRMQLQEDHDRALEPLRVVFQAAEGST